MLSRPNRSNRVRVYDAEGHARSITETFKDRPVEYEETLSFDWPDVVQNVGDSLGVAYASDKWKPKNAKGRREWEVYKHIAESRNRIFSVPGVIRDERRNKLDTIGPLVSLKKSSKDGSLLMPSHVSILGIFKEANVELYTDGTDENPGFDGDDSGIVTLSVSHGMLGASKMKLMGKLVPFLFVYTPADGVFFIIIGDELDIEKDGIVG